MKLGFIFKNCASIGGWNYTALLAKHLKKCYPSWEIKIFCLQKDPMLDLLKIPEQLEPLGIKIVRCSKRLGRRINNRSILSKINSHFLTRFAFKYYNRYIDHKDKKIVKKFSKIIDNNCDVIFYPWPYGSSPFKINKPTFFIPHDFIYTHWFGLHSGNESYNSDIFCYTRTIHGEYLDVGSPIVSSPYISDELKRTFPNIKKKINVVFLSKFNEFDIVSRKTISDFLIANGIHHDYILWPSNCMYHKNLAQLLGAFYKIKQKFPSIKLILTGHGTDNIKVSCNSDLYCDHVDADSDDWDVMGLGVLPPDEFSIILQGAKIVINSSLCEAGSGSALDAWGMGIPVALSNIQSFKEQVAFLNTNAAFFDPKNSSDIAKSIIEILNNYKKHLELAKQSKIEIEKYTWDIVAKKYAKIFAGNLKENQK